MRKTEALEIEGREVTLSNVDKVMFPDTGFTKGQVIDYYVRVSRFILPHLFKRPLTLKRYPEGVAGEFFYEKNAPRFTPKWIKRAPVERTEGKGLIHFLLLNDLPSLAWTANLASIELHVFLSQAPRIQRPTSMVFDLDPGSPADFLSCAEVALQLRDLLRKMGLESWVKSSGSKGLQLYVPLNTPVTYDDTRPLAKKIAETLSQAAPERVVSKMAKDLRGGKVFIDWSQNAAHKTTVCVYSLRAKRHEPFVSFPIDWPVLEKAMKAADLGAFLVNPEEALKRLEKEGDLFAEVLTTKQKLPSRTKADALLSGFSFERPKKRLKGVGDRTLNAYKAKRDFSQTKEPPAAALKGGSSRHGMFVIQKHAASRLHYDFRLGMDGVLKSWAVPKGPPFTRAERRLAMHVEDHPMSYKDFEGTIAPGNYGAGAVMVWDSGTYELLDGSMEKGKLHVRLEGKKLSGEWILVRGRQEGSGEPWFLIKGGKSMEPISAKRDDQSAVSGRTMDQIAKDNDRQWRSNRAGGAKSRPSRRL